LLKQTQRRRQQHQQKTSAAAKMCCTSKFFKRKDEISCVLTDKEQDFLKRFSAIL